MILKDEFSSNDLYWTAFGFDVKTSNLNVEVSVSLGPSGV
jgi:hypothetical protein